MKKNIKKIILRLYNTVYKKVHRLYYVHGKWENLILGENIILNNTICNTVSGKIIIGDNTIFGHNCMLLTGNHEFKDGKRKKLIGISEVPNAGREIKIGTGCFIASGSIIIGPVIIGNNVIVGAGSVVTKSFPDGVFIAGNPASIKSTHTSNE